MFPSNSPMGLGPPAQTGRGRDLPTLVGGWVVGFSLVAVLLALACVLLNRTAPQLPAATFASAEDWPEIKNGVPELKERGATASDPTHGADPLKTAGSAPADGPAPTLNGFAGQDQNATAVAAQEATGSVHTGRPEPSETNTETQRLGAIPTTHSAGPHADSANRDRNMAGSRVEREPARERKGGQGMAPRPSASLQPSPAKPRVNEAAARPPKARPPEAKRTRTADIQPPVRPESLPAAPVTPPPAEAERVRLLGIPLPRAREIKECLLEFRC